MTDQNQSSLQQQPKSIRDQVALLSFLDNLIKEKNDPLIKPEQLQQVKAALLQELNEMINIQMVKSLSEADQRQLDAMFDRKANDEEIDDFFVKKIPNLSAEIASVLLDFRAAYLTPLNAPSGQTQQQNQNLPPSPSVAQNPPAPSQTRPDFPPPAPVPVDKVN